MNQNKEKISNGNKSFLPERASIINCCGEIITASIIKEVKLSKFYSLSADEAQDFQQGTISYSRKVCK